ncbi:MAG: DUF1330 domain-containing protein [Chloroflexi bacterium]|nr:DUF1330 domain-containing protein [Chloroflexota bacterium]
MAAYLFMRHKVADYKKWKSVFEGARTLRRDGGQKAGQIFQVEGDPNNLLVILEWESLDKAHKFTQSAELRQAMQQAGVVEQPEVYFLSEVTSVPKP